VNTTDDTYAAAREALKKLGYQFSDSASEAFCPPEAVMGMLAGLEGAKARGFKPGGHKLAAKVAWDIWRACYGVVMGDAA